MKTSTYQPSRSERGQALIELALTLTLLLVLLAGVIDLGRGFFTYMALRDAAQEGATYGTLNPSDTSGIESRVRESSNFPVQLSDTTLIQVQSFLSGAACHGNSVRVEVTYNSFPITAPFLGAILGTQTIPIHARVIDTILRPPCN